jgi:hypothetical protein
MSAALQARTHLKISKKSIEKANRPKIFVWGRRGKKKNFEDTLGSQVCCCLFIYGDTRIYPTTNKQKGKVSVKPESSF